MYSEIISIEKNNEHHVYPLNAREEYHRMMSLLQKNPKVKYMDLDELADIASVEAGKKASEISAQCRTNDIWIPLISGPCLFRLDRICADVAIGPNYLVSIGITNIDSGTMTGEFQLSDYIFIAQGSYRGKLQYDFEEGKSVLNWLKLNDGQSLCLHLQRAIRLESNIDIVIQKQSQAE